jgi:hypothetical protein
MTKKSTPLRTCSGSHKAPEGPYRGEFLVLHRPSAKTQETTSDQGIPMTRAPSLRFTTLQRSGKDWQRWRLQQGYNYAQAAQEHQISVREWGMLECRVSPEDLRDGLYPYTKGGEPRRFATRR